MWEPLPAFPILPAIFADTFFSYITPLVIKIYLLKDKIFYCNILYYSGRKLMGMLNYYSQLKLYFFYLFLFIFISFISDNNKSVFFSISKQQIPIMRLFVKNTLYVPKKRVNIKEKLPNIK